MDLPTSLVLRSGNYCMDGGTTRLECADEAERPHVVMLVQRSFPGGRTFGIPGRLYFDGELVPMRSEAESRLLALLGAAEVRRAPRPAEPPGERVISPDALVLS